MNRYSKLLWAFLPVVLLFVFACKTVACTSFIVSGKATKDGRPMIFKNRDTGEVNNVVVVEQGDLYRYMGITAFSDKKPNDIWGGHNEVGFAIINTAAYNLNGCEGKDTDNDGRVMRRALEVCRTLADFEHLLDTLPKPMDVNSNFGVLDGEGGCAYYETGKSWLCTQSIAQKKKVFSLRRGNTRNYIDLSKLVNGSKTGILQRTAVLEQEVLERGIGAIKKVRKGKSVSETLRDYYQWVDEYVKAHYPQD